MSSFLAFIDFNNDTNPDAELMFYTAGTLTSGNFIVRYSIFEENVLWLTG